MNVKKKPADRLRKYIREKAIDSGAGILPKGRVRQVARTYQPRALPGLIC